MLWSTLPFLGLQNIKRFLPTSLLMGVIEGANAIIEKKNKNGGYSIISQTHTYLENFL